MQFDPELVDVFADIFAAGVPWEPDSHAVVPGLEHAHAHPHEHAHEHPDEHPDHGTPAVAVVHAAWTRGSPPRRRRTTAELHDAVHERRRRAS